MDIKRRNYQYSNSCPVPLLASFGCASTLFSEFLTYPLEYAKTKLQINGTQGCEKYKNVRNLIKSTPSMMEFYRGFNAHLLKMIPYSTTRVFAYEFLKTAMTGDIVETSYLRKLSASASACAVALLTGNIGDVLRIRMINSRSSINEVIRQTYNVAGITGFFRGYSLNLITVLSIQSLEIALFDRIKEFFVKNFGLNGYPLITNSAVGTITGITAALISAPIDGYKTRYMNQVVKQANYWQTFANVLKDEGLMGLYKGTLPYCLKLTTGSILTLVFYEQFKKCM